MRTYHYKPEAQDNLADLRALADIDTINAAVKELANGTKSGYLIPLQSPFLSAKKKLYRYDVGRYKLNYTLTKRELQVESVMI